MRAGKAAFSQTEVLAEAIVPLLSPPPTEPARGCHIPDSISLSHTVWPCLDSLRPCLTQLSGPPKLFPVPPPHIWLILAHASDSPEFSQTSSIWPQPHTSALAMANLGFQPRLPMAPPDPKEVTDIFILLCSLCLVVLGRTQMEVVLDLLLLGGPRGRSLSVQLQSTSKHHYPTISKSNTFKGRTQQESKPAEGSPALWKGPFAHVILHCGQRLMVTGHSQSLQLIGLGKSLPLICQQQSRLNYKARVYTGLMVGTT